MFKLTIPVKSQFEMGNVVVTEGVDNLISENFDFLRYVLRCLKRHANCDWGDLDSEDVYTNENAMLMGDRLFSYYESAEFPKIYIITEAGGLITTVLYPDEY